MSVEAIVLILHISSSGFWSLGCRPRDDDSFLSDQATQFMESTECSKWREAVENVHLNIVSSLASINEHLQS